MRTEAKKVDDRARDLVTRLRKLGLTVDVIRTRTGFAKSTIKKIVREATA